MLMYNKVTWFLKQKLETFQFSCQNINEISLVDIIRYYLWIKKQNTVIISNTYYDVYESNGPLQIDQNSIITQNIINKINKYDKYDNCI